MINTLTSRRTYTLLETEKRPHKPRLSDYLGFAWHLTVGGGFRILRRGIRLATEYDQGQMAAWRRPTTCKSPPMPRTG